METHPPRLIERAVGTIIPPACREHVLGDLHERYTSPAQYIFEALRTLPYIIASQVRRTFRLDLFVAQAAALYIAFGGASLAGGPGYLYDRGALIPLAIVIGVVLMALVLSDAYRRPEGQPARRRMETILALACAYMGQIVLRFIHPEWTLPAWIMLAGAAVSISMLMVLRKSFLEDRRDTAVSGGGVLPPDEIRRRSAEQYRKAWRANWIWLIAAFAVMFVQPQLRPESGWWNAGSALFLIFIILVTGLRSKKGLVGTEQRFTALSLSRDPYRHELERKRDGLLFWAGGGLFSLAPGAGPALIFYLIAFPLVVWVVGWIAGAPMPESVSTTRVWLAFIAFAVLCAAWAFVRTLNLRAAQAIREELKSLESSKKRQ